WHYGDVMHSFDADRQVWCYDVGGHAWTNSEFSPDLWLWYAFLRSGRADIFRFAEAMTRHTGEVDVYHLGPWAGLGTRHGVTHWGDSCKQHRIANALYRRIFYYLTADERAGDLLRELADSERTFLMLDPLRKIRTDSYPPDPAALDVGVRTDWGALAGAWFTEWERNGPRAAEARDKLLTSMASIAALPRGFLQADARYDLATGRPTPAWTPTRRRGSRTARTPPAPGATSSLRPCRGSTDTTATGRPGRSGPRCTPPPARRGCSRRAPRSSPCPPSSASPSSATASRSRSRTAPDGDVADVVVLPAEVVAYGDDAVDVL